MMLEEQYKQLSPTLQIGDRTLTLGKAGFYNITLEDFRKSDLRMAPAGIDLLVTGTISEDRLPEDLIQVVSVRVVSPLRVEVIADHFRCGGCWDHALSYSKYTSAVDILLTMSPALPASFLYWGCRSVDDVSERHLFQMSCRNELGGVIERELLDAMSPVLRPLLDYRDALDAEVRKQFAV